MAYRDDVTALSARHDALTAEVAQKTRELEESSRLLEHARARARLPVLDQIRIASPCSADWNQMTGDDRTRHCCACDKDVYNLSSMTRDEAEALIVERNGELCVRYYQRADGTILLADCTVGVQRKRKRRRTTARAAALVAGGLAAAGGMALPGRATEPPCAIPRDGYVAGGLQAAPEPPPPPSAPARVAAPPRPPEPMMGGLGPSSRYAAQLAAELSQTAAHPAKHPAKHPPAAAGKRAR